MRGCSVDGCERPHYGKGLCHPHWKRQRKGHDLSRKTVYEMTDKERFDAKWVLGDGGCWLWASPGNPNGVPTANTFWLNKTVMNAIKASFLLHKGRVPKGKFICHTCDNRLCVNPDHLWLGTAAENTADMYAKGRNRNPRGSTHYAARLTEEDVRRVRREMTDAPRGTLARLCRELSVNKATLQDILQGKTWKHVGDY